MNEKKVEESIIDNLLKIEGLSAEELIRYKNDIVLNIDKEHTEEPK